MSTHIPCLEWAELVRKYSDAIKIRAHLITLLAQATSDESDAFTVALRRCEASRALCADLQEQLYEHFRSHQWQTYTGVREGPAEPAHLPEQ